MASSVHDSLLRSTVGGLGSNGGENREGEGRTPFTPFTLWCYMWRVTYTYTSHLLSDRSLLSTVHSLVCIADCEKDFPLCPLSRKMTGVYTNIGYYFHLSSFPHKGLSLVEEDDWRKRRTQSALRRALTRAFGSICVGSLLGLPAGLLWTLVQLTSRMRRQFQVRHCIKRFLGDWKK
jgi:hypothetical protein